MHDCDYYECDTFARDSPPLTGFEVSKLYDILREKKAGDLPTCHSLLRHLPTNVSYQM